MSNFKLCPSLESLLLKLRERRKFDISTWIPKKIQMYNEYMRKNGLTAAIVAVSGGVDSAVTLALCHKAMQQKDCPCKKLVALALPIASTDEIWKRALELKKYSGAEFFTINATDVFENLKRRCDKSIGIEGGRFAGGQLKSYLRTPIYYYTAQLLTQQGTPALIVGTGNYDEDLYLYYYAKAGDGVVDISLLGDLHKSEVVQVGKELGVPESILNCDPSADLWAGQTDEQELGITYDWVELYTEYVKYSLEEQAEMRSELDDEGMRQFEEWEKLLRDVHTKSKHKAIFPVNLNVFHVSEYE